MTTKNMEARREAFEAFAKNRGASLVKDQAGHYLVTENEWAFEIWNAALDSICVELPKPLEIDGAAMSRLMLSNYNMTVQACREAIHAAGIKTK